MDIFSGKEPGLRALKLEALSYRTPKRPSLTWKVLGIWIIWETETVV